MPAKKPEKAEKQTPKHKDTKEQKGQNTQDTSTAKTSPKTPLRKGPGFFKQLVLTVVIITLVGVLYSSFAEKNIEGKDTELSLSEVVQMVNAGQVDSIVVRGDKLEITLHPVKKEVAGGSVITGTKKEEIQTQTSGGVVNKEQVKKEEPVLEYTSKKERGASLTDTLQNYGVSPEALLAVSIENKEENSFGFYIGRILPLLIPLIILGVIIWFFSAQMKGGMKGGPFSVGQSKAKMMDPNAEKVTFADVAGNGEAKRELIEVVDFLKFPKKYMDIGAKIPKGVLLTGAPGTGKTLLARAVAGEADVPFFHLSGSEFVEMFVGVGASRVRDLFAQAKKVAPAIIFIDEIDAVGRHRGVGIGSGHDEREQTLNQILVEMDGFEANQKVIIMAATNRPDVLDGALLRPGRFDRQVMLELPDRKDRLEILQIHSRKKKIASDVTLDVVAERTPGFSGADLDSLMNEAAILTARRDKKEIGQLEVLESIEKVMIGPERTSHLHTEKERKLTAYHEAGHAIIASALPNADPVHKVSIVARGHAGGYTLKLPLEDKKMHSKKEFLDDIAMSLGGYVAEQMIFDDVTTGPSNDLQVSTKLARSMVTKWGMSDAIGPVALEGNDGQALFGSGVDKNQHSDRHEQLIDDEVSKIMNNALAVARETLTKHRDALEAVAQKLLETETLEQEQYNEIIAKFGLVGKVSEEKVG